MIHAYYVFLLAVDLHVKSIRDKPYYVLMIVVTGMTALLSSGVTGLLHV